MTDETDQNRAPAYWRDTLRGAPTVLDLPSDRSRQPGAPHGPAVRTWSLPADLAESLEAFGDREGVGLAVVAATAFELLLARYSDQADFAIGVTADETTDVLVLRADLAGRPTAREALHRVARALGEGQEHALPLPRLLEAVGPETEPGAHPLFQVGFARSAGAFRDLASGGLDLVLAVGHTDEGVQASFDYDPALFDAETVERMAGHLEALLRGIVAEPERRAAWLPLLTAEEERRILRAWNDTATDFPRDRCLHRLFEDNARARPEAIAVIAEDQTLSYAELDRRANRLAHQLRDAGVRPEVRVGLCVERSVGTAVGILGILKAGGAYVPLDPEYPKDRLEFMLGDADVAVLVTQERLRGELPAHGARVVSLDGEADAIAARPDGDPASSVEPDNLAYVIYTSGSTGRPKGIALRHRGVVNNLTDLNDSFDVGPEDRVLAISALSFDMCVYEVLGTLAAGGAIVIPDAAAAMDPAYLAELVVRHGVTVWNSAPALLEMFVDHVETRPELAPRTLRVAIQGGDWEPVTLPDRLKALAPGVNVIVLGGATEASIHSIVFPVERTDPAWTSIPYGVPMRNQKAYLLDGELQPVPVGVPGELYLGGIGLARGYFRQPALTAERFLPSPFADEPGERIYRTGDLARWMPDGNIELLGRMDHQVKIRGHRIELGEIAAVLRDHPDVQDTVITALDDGGAKRLVAYVVAAEAGADGDGRSAQADQVGQWQKVYDDTYGRAAPGGDATRNFVGWHSSYTGLPFADEELTELQDGTVAAIRALAPKRVLEIGCGTGLVLFPVAPDCERYDGIDVSPVVIENLKRLVSRPGAELPQVHLRAGSADDLAGTEAEAYDTVIINSVSQHFPSIEYFARVLEGASQAVKPGGAIFVGDVRSLPHLPTFCHALESGQAPPDLPAEDLAERVRKRLWQEKELFVDPGFFAAVRERLPSVSRVEIRLKRGRHHNEMTKFHYDVVLRVGGDAARASEDVDWRDWRTAGLTVDGVRGLLSSGETDALALRRVPNGRALAEVAPVDEGAPPVAEGVDPEDLWALADDLPYDVAISWSGPEHPGSFDALLVRRGVASPSFPVEETKHTGAWSRYGNNPLQATTAARLTPELRDHLQRRLPEYMLPSAYVYLDALPLSPNGKLDRKALPAPTLERVELEADFMEPRNSVERVLASIWSDVLGVDRVGIQDDFFELGGHSLTAAKATSRARDSFQVDIPLRSLFERPTVAGWGASVVSAGAAAQVDVPAIADVLLELEQMTDDEVRAQLDPGSNSG